MTTKTTTNKKPTQVMRDARVRDIAESLLSPADRQRALNREREAQRIARRQDVRAMLACGNHEGVVAILRDERDLGERASLWAALEHAGQVAVATECPEVLPIAQAAIGPLAVQLLRVDLDDEALPDVLYVSGPSRRTTARCEVDKDEADVLSDAGLTISTTLREDDPLPASTVRQDWLKERSVAIPERPPVTPTHRYWCAGYAFGYGAMEQLACERVGHQWVRNPGSPEPTCSRCGLPSSVSVAPVAKDGFVAPPRETGTSVPRLVSRDVVEILRARSPEFRAMAIVKEPTLDERRREAKLHVTRSAEAHVGALGSLR